MWTVTSITDLLKIMNSNIISQNRLILWITEETGMLKMYKASLKLNENVALSNHQARKLSLRETKKIMGRRTFWICCSWWQEIGIVVLRKADGDFQICNDYKMRVKVCSNSYLILNIDVALHSLARMRAFTKIDLKAAYHQISNEQFKEVITINVPIALSSWTKVLYRIKTASAVFQITIEQIIGYDIENIVGYQNDICIVGRNEIEQKKKKNLNQFAD